MWRTRGSAACAAAQSSRVARAPTLLQAHQIPVGSPALTHLKLTPETPTPSSACAMASPSGLHSNGARRPKCRCTMLASSWGMASGRGCAFTKAASSLCGCASCLPPAPGTAFSAGLKRQTLGKWCSVWGGCICRSARITSSVY